jgi:hypothetical protein
VANGVRQVVDLTSTVRKTSDSDAGTIRFDKADPAALWQLRTRVAAMVAAILHGAAIVRVHAARPSVEAARIADAVLDEA